MPDDTLPISTRWETVADVLSGLSVLEAEFVSRRDKRGVFATAYVLITRELSDRLDGGVFEDAEWLRRYIPTFADLYRQALVAYRDEPDACPKPWRIAFDAAATGSLLIQDVFLGINAHMNHDLPLALSEVTIDPDRERRYRDHVRVNDALVAATDPVQDRIKDLYAPGLGLVDVAIGDFDEVLTNFSFGKAREAAWWGGVSLVDAGTDEERARRIADIEDRSAVLGRLILAPSERFPLLFPALRWLERLGPDWPDLVADTEPSIQPGDAMLDEAEPVVESVAQVIDRLEATVSEFDGERSRLSIYPTVYLGVTRRLQQALADGVFEEPAWVEQLDLHFASQYFRILDAFKQNRRTEIPLCWQTALDATTAGETLVIQDLVLSVNARLYHDLGIALWRAWLLEGDVERRIRDFKRIHDVFKASIGPAQDTLAAKYTGLLRLADIAGLSLDELVVDILYVQARDAALENARALAAADSGDERRATRRRMDRNANRQAQQILLRGVVGQERLIGLLRRFEERHQGSWSSYLVAAPLYERVMGEEFEHLPTVLRQFHRAATGASASGTMRVSRRGGLIGKQIGDLLGLPTAGDAVPIRLQVSVEGDKERWVRWFGDKETKTMQWEDDGLLVEEGSAMRFHFELSTDGDSLEFRQRHVKLFPFFPLPRFAAPRSQAKMTARGDGWDVEVSVSVPVLGRVIEYQGFVRPD